MSFHLLSLAREGTEVDLAGVSMAPEAQKHLLPNHPSWGGLLTRYDTARGPHTEILCKRMSWIVAQTIVRQLLSVVNTSI